MNIVSAVISKTGGRKENQDYADFIINDTAGLWIVADGLGGHRGGEVASKTAVEAVMAEWRPEAALTTRTVESLISSAQNAIIEKQNRNVQLSSMRTTLVLILQSKAQVLWGHVGDSRLYHFRDCAVAFQTKDHSVPQALVDAGDITKAEIREHPDRNRILRAVGNPDIIKSTILDKPCQIKPGDAFLLCTDGFWEYVTEIEMSVDLVKSTSPEDWLKRMELRLLGKVEAENDNYTALAIFVEG